MLFTCRKGGGLRDGKREVPLKTLVLGGFRQMSVPGFAAMSHEVILWSLVSLWFPKVSAP